MLHLFFYFVWSYLRRIFPTILLFVEFILENVVAFPNITIAYLISLKLGKLKLDTKIDFVQFVIQLFFSPKDLLYFKRVSQIDFRGGKEKSKKPAKPFLFQNTSIFYAKSKIGTQYIVLRWKDINVAVSAQIPN